MHRRRLMIILAVFCSLLFTMAAHAQLPQISSGLSYLNASQNTDGTWGNAASVNEATAVTVASIETLKTLNQTAGSAYTNATTRLQGQSPNSVAYIAERIRVLNITDSSITVLLPKVDPSKGAWGGDDDFATNNLDTALALQALKSSNYPDLSISNNALISLTNTQNNDGGWGFSDGDDSTVYITSIVTATLRQFPQTASIASAISRASAYLVSVQNIDGGFGVSASGIPASSAYETALAYIALVGDGQSSAIPQQKALTYLISIQSANGSWNNDPYSTALAVKALYLSENKPAPSQAPLTTAGIMGTVVDAITNSPLAGVTAVLVSNPAISATTNATGTFVLNGIANGWQQITLSLAGYATQTITATLNAGDFINTGTIGLSATPTTGTVQGVVWDTEVNAPYYHVTVRVQSGSNTYETFSAEDGSYRITNVPAGTVTVGTPAGPKGGYYNIQLTDNLTPGGVLIYNPRMSKTSPTNANLYLRADKTTYHSGDSVALTVNIQNNKAIGYPETLKLHVTDASGTSVYDASIDLNLIANSLLTQNASFVLPATAHGGTFTAKAELYGVGGTVVATASSNFELWVIPIAVSPKLPAQFSLGANTINFDLTNNRSTAVSAGALAMTMTDPDGQVVTSASQPFALAPGETKTLSYALSFPALKFGTYTLSYTQTDEITNGQTGTISLSNSINVSALFDKYSYKKNGTANLLISMNNTGKFNLDDVSVNVDTPDAVYADSKAVAIASGATVTQQNAIPLPETITTGEHTSSVTLALSGGSSISKSVSCLISQTILGVTPTDGSKDVPVRASILVRFSENVDPSLVLANMVSLTTNGVDVPGTIRVTPDGSALIFKPLGKLDYAKAFTFTIKGSVRDQVGKSTVIDLTFTFSTPMADLDLVGYWPMDGDWNDYSGYGNNGTGYASSVFTGGRVAGVSSGNFVIDSRYFEGSGGYVPTPAKFVDFVSNTFTMSFWAKPTATRETTQETNNNYVLGEGVQRFAIAPVNMYNLGYYGAIAGVSVGTNGISVFEETTLADGGFAFGYFPSLLVYDAPTPLTGWNHIAVVYNNKQPSLYLNGALVRTGQTSQQPDVFPSAVFAFGNERATGAYSGQMEGVVYHERALTAQEILAFYQGQTKAVPQVSLTSPGQAVKYKPGETGSATVFVSSTTGITRLYCGASGATTDGALVINFEQPQVQITQQFSFIVAADAVQYAPIVLSCTTQTVDGVVGAGELLLQAADLIAPTVVSSVPANNAIDVSATIPVSIIFSEAMDPTSVVSRDTFKFRRADNGAWVSGMFSMSADNKTLMIFPSPALDGSTSYIITLSGVRDLAGNSLSNDYVLRFTTLQQTSLAINNQGTPASPYVLPTGHYGTLTLSNSYVTASGGVTVDTLTMDHSALNVNPSAAVPGNLSVAYGDMSLTNSSQVNVDGTLNLAANVNLTNSTMAVTGAGTIAGNLGMISSTLTLKSQLHVTGDVSLQNNSILTHYASTTTDTSKIDVTAANMTIDATSKIDASGKGYLGGFQEGNTMPKARTLGNTTAGGSDGTNGGSYGGVGGGTGSANVVYGDIANPNEVGSGGSGLIDDSSMVNTYYLSGGNGGGLIRLTALNSLSLEGEVAADGATAAIGGGSGGGIRIEAGNISGQGSIHAKGGSSTGILFSSGGGGGGGRVAVYYGSMTLPAEKIVASAGRALSDTPAGNGGAGMIYLKDNGRPLGELIVNNGGVSSGTKTPVSGSFERVDVAGGADITGGYLLNNELIFKNAQLTVSDLSVLTGNVTLITSNLNATSVLSFPGNLTLEGSSLSAAGAVNVAGSLALNHASTLSHFVSTATTSYKLDVTASSVSIDDTSKIDVSSKGQLGGRQPGNNANAGLTYGPNNTIIAGSSANNGGSYGGLGGYDSGTVNAVYGSIQQPNEVGSGGGGLLYYDTNLGGNGGGLVKLTAGTLSLSGSILADGGAGVSSGGGSGGAILLNVGSLDGTGKISANGGIGSFGGGGGGRIAIYYTTNTLPNAKISAAGGKGGTGTNPIKNGGAGTIYLKDSSKTLGELIVNNGGNSSGNKTTVSGSYERIDVAEGTNITGSYLMNNELVFINTQLTFNDLSSLAGNLTLVSSTLNATNVSSFPGNLTFDGSSLTVGDAVNVAGTLKLKNASVLSHFATAATVSYKLDVTAGAIDIDVGSKIDVSGKGYLGSWQPGNSSGTAMSYRTIGGSTFFAGGSHGGFGGDPYGYSVGARYGSSTLPNESGSGGGGSNASFDHSLGGNGGGQVKLSTGTLHLDGNIEADGGMGPSGGGGSGGSILVVGGNISGQGKIYARGGASSYGGGGGGRIAIYYDSNTLLSDQILATGGASGSSPAWNGADGTIYLSQNLLSLNVTKAGTATGTVQSTPAGINCGANCSANFAKNSSISLIAAPDANSTFIGWSGACAGTGTCTVTMDAAKMVTATFAQTNPVLSVVFAGNGQGSIMSSPSGIACNTNCSSAFSAGTMVTFSPQPAQQSYFKGWSNGQCSGTESCQVTMGNNASVTATFDILPPSVDFSGTPTLGYAPLPLPVTFTSQTQRATSWLWDFGDGNSSTALNPVHTYQSMGNFTVTLTATNSSGSTVLSKANYVVVTVCPNPVRNVRLGSLYSTIGAAYAEALDGDNLQLVETTFLEGLNSTKNIVLDGGYICDFSVKTGGLSVLKGAQSNVISGSLTVKDIFIDK